ncbi:MAG: ABC transporter substrate-binding protein [Sphaerochaeta sp.]|nr:ABC transporter substrate-binding protein [Sphaerochaeta sp.]
MRKRMLFPIFLTLLFLLVFSSCKRNETAENLPSLKVGMMSAVDAAPFYLAQERGYFTEQGVDAQLILFTNGQNRQTALQTGQVDGAMTDLVALITQSANAFRLVGTLSTDGDFPLLAKSEIQDSPTLSVGTMEISVTNYLVEQYLGTDHTLKKVYINEIPARLEAVASGQLDAGIFPEPFASVGAMRGLKKVFFPGIPAESLNIIAFTEAAIQEKEAALTAFHRAYAQAVEDIEQDPSLARSMIMRHIPNLPAEIEDLIQLPTYHAPRLPNDEFVRQIMDWTASVTKQTYAFGTESFLNRRFIEDL